MKKLLGLCIVLSFLVAGCGQEQTKKTDLEKQEGIIVDIREHQNGRNQMLVVPNIMEEDISNKKLSDLIKLAQKKDGAYYSFEIGEYEEFKVGSHVIVYWNGFQLDSNPPQRGLKKIEIIKE